MNEVIGTVAVFAAAIGVNAVLHDLAARMWITRSASWLRGVVGPRGGAR